MEDSSTGGCFVFSLQLEETGDSTCTFVGCVGSRILIFSLIFLNFS
jgi:hypothetical protein